MGTLRHVIILTIFLPLNVAAEQFCFYVDSRGKVIQVADQQSAPARYQQAVKCQAKSKTRLATPDKVEIEGNEGRRVLSTELGEVDLRWDRASKRLFGTTPQYALLDAMRSVNRALKQGVFPSEVRDLDLNWRIVFFAGSLPAGQIPRNLISNCHPGWMTPPSNIYIVADRVAQGCGGHSSSLSSADKKMARVLVHELAHAVEAQIIPAQMGRCRACAEGFATWATYFISRSSSLLSQSALKREHFDRAKVALRRGKSIHPSRFDGSAEGYALAAMYFYALEKRYQARGVFEVYELMREDNLDFFSAAKARYGWDLERFDKEIRKLLKV